jgi:dipeptidase E
MNLYLSSFRIGDSGVELAGLCGSGRAFVVSNALDFSRNTEHRQNVIAREIEDLGQLGITAEPLDLRNFFGKSQLLRNHLENAAMLWVAGGNTFVLRRAMSLSGLDEIISSKRGDPNFLYAGYSAGACVLSPSLEGIHLADNPQAEPEGYSGEVLWSGLGLIDYYFVPHFRCDHPESSAMEDVVAFYDLNALPYRTAADGQVIIDRTLGSEQDGRGAPCLTFDV